MEIIRICPTLLTSFNGQGFPSPGNVRHSHGGKTYKISWFHVPPMKIFFLQILILGLLILSNMLAAVRSHFPRSPIVRGARSYAGLSFAQVGVVKPSPGEVKNLQLDARNLEKAVKHVHRDGLVVVEDIVPHEHLDFLNQKMIEDAETLLARGDKGPFNYNKGNIQQDPPPVSEFFYPSIFTSKFFLKPGYR